MFCFRQREFGDRRAEAELEPLQQDRMVYSSLLSTPAEYPVAQDDFHAFRFAFDPAIKLVKILEYFHCGPGWPLVRRPQLSTCLPLLQGRYAFGIAAESHRYGVARGPLIT